MPTTSLRAALKAALAGAEPGLVFRTDADLLTAFAAERDEAAFAELVRRHGRLVRGTARRLAEAADAEDVFQATFLLLARKAAAKSWGPTVGPWLYQATVRLAAKSRSRAARRPTAGPMSANIASPVIDPASGLAWAEVQSALDRALAALPGRLRDPLVLCYLEGLTRDEAAAALGCSSAAIKGRVARGRERLRQLLAIRGLALSAALAASLVSEPAIRAGEAAITAKAAATFLTTGVAPAAVRSLLPVTLGWQVVAGLAAVMLACAAGEVGLGRAVPAGEPPPAAAEIDAPPPAQVPAPRTMRVFVLDPQGKPLSGAKVHSSIWTNDKGVRANRDYQTDTAGAALVELPQSYYILRLWASKKPFADMFSHWEQNELASGVTVPAEYTIRLMPAVTAGGRVVDEQGKPIAGAKVEVSLHDQKPLKADGRTQYDGWLANGKDAVTTDADGRWHIDNLPDDPRIEVNLDVSHPDFVHDDVWRTTVLKSGVTTANLRDQSAKVTLRPGIVVTGQVCDPAGKPIENAIIAYGRTNSWDMCSTGADGRFRMPPQNREDMSIVVIAKGYAPQFRRVNLESKTPHQTFQMAAGKTVRLKLVDADGKPVEKATVRPWGWKGNQSLETIFFDKKLVIKADASGVWEWTWAPDDAVKFRIDAPDFARQEVVASGGEPERTIVMKAEHRVRGQVTDAVTGKSIESFTVIPVDVFRKDWLNAERFNCRIGKAGRLDFLVDRIDIPQRLRIEAPGYRTQTGPEFRIGDDTARVQDFRLQPSLPIVGTVLDTEGRPASKAQVFVGTPTEHADFRPFHEGHCHSTATDSSGRFSFPDPGEPIIIAVRSDAGFAQAEFPRDQHDAGTLRLRAWASVRGRFRDGGKPIAGATVFVQPIGIRNLDEPQVESWLETTTGPDGRFEFPRVPPGAVCVHVFLGPWKDDGFRSGPHVPLDLQPAQRVELDLGGRGAIVTGNVKLTGKVPADLDCTYSINYLVRRAAGITPPPRITALGFDATRGWRENWQLSEEGRAFMSTLQHWFVKLSPDGSFRVSGVPAGEYDLAVAVYAKPNGCLVEPLARKVVRINVSADDVARGELTIPEIAATVAPIPGVGDELALKFTRADGSAGSLADFRGKCLLVHFWASWCGPCKEQLPTVRNLHAQFAGRGLTTLGLSVDDDAAVWRDAVKRLNLTWPQGRVTAETAGVSSVPMYWLIGPDGKILVKSYDTDEIIKTLNERLK